MTHLPHAVLPRRASANLDLEPVDAVTLGDADKQLTRSMFGTLASAVRSADELARMDKAVALSPMPCARFVYHPETSHPLHLLLNRAMQELTAADEREFLSPAGAVQMADLVHGEDKAELNRAFFTAIGRQRGHAYVSLRIKQTQAGGAVWVPRVEHQFLQFYPNGRLAAVTIVEDTSPATGLLRRALPMRPRALAAQQVEALRALLYGSAPAPALAEEDSGPAGPLALPLAPAAVAPASTPSLQTLVQRFAPDDRLAQWALASASEARSIAPANVPRVAALPAPAQLATGTGGAAASGAAAPLPQLHSRAGAAAGAGDSLLAPVRQRVSEAAWPTLTPFQQVLAVAWLSPPLPP